MSPTVMAVSARVRDDDLMTIAFEAAVQRYATEATRVTIANITAHADWDHPTFTDARMAFVEAATDPEDHRVRSSALDLVAQEMLRAAMTEVPQFAEYVRSVALRLAALDDAA